ncbi:phage tail protein [Pedobacter cryoconitis]|uniref:Uncharacterized protein n=1 Tax=Pedobacter cryoconitis TaxID=188932 RepID=A0A327S8J4_9SPHI|nr:hypothetical protein [Pedobacter cryoconitis]RAJ24995.1 hypothetical protein LY11_04182 [Pedobacter cryoconitis]
MSQVNFIDKSQNVPYDPTKINAQDLNEIKVSVNSKADQTSFDALKTVAKTGSFNDLIDKPTIGAGNASIDDAVISPEKTYSSTKVETLLIGKASKINGLIPEAELPEVVFSNLSGSGTRSDPYLFQGNSTGLTVETLTALMRSLPNWGADKIFQGNMTWIDAPTGGGEQLDKLNTSTLVAGIIGGDIVPLSWNYVANGTTYTIQRDTNLSFANAVLVYSGSANSVIATGLSPLTDYVFRLRVTGTGFAGSNYFILSVKTDVQGKATPAAPIFNGNDSANTLTLSHPLGNSELLISENGGSFIPYTTQINVGNVNRPFGYWVGKTRSNADRNESPLASSPAFTGIVSTPAKPTLPVNNNSSYSFSWTYTAGYTTPSAYEGTKDGGATFVTLTAKPWNIGAGDYSSGQIGVRVKAVDGINNASPWLFNTVGFSLPLVSVALTQLVNDGYCDIIENNVVTVNEQGQYAYVSSPLTLPIGGAGFIMMDLNEPDGVQTMSIGFQTSSQLANAPSYEMYSGSNGDHKFLAHNGNTYAGSPILPRSANTKGRIRANGTIIYFEYSTDAGVSWTSLTNVPQPQSVLYIRAVSGSQGFVLQNLQYSGGFV